MLSVQNLKVSIGEVQILKGIDMEVPSGELHAIMGPNGSGKSTFCHAVMGNPDYEPVSYTYLTLTTILLV
mgnify:CR=1 FL=1